MTSSFEAVKLSIFSKIVLLFILDFFPLLNTDSDQFYNIVDKLS